MSVAQAHHVSPAQPIIQFPMALARDHVRAALISATACVIVVPITALPALVPHLAVRALTLPSFS